MDRLAKVTLAPADGVANGYAQAQAPGGAGNLNLNGALVAGGVGTPDIPRRVVIHSAANDSARTFTITGTDRYKRPLVEALKGANAGDAISLNDFATVTQIAIDGAAAGNVTAGTNQSVSTQWIPVNRLGAMDLGIQVDQSVGAAVTWSIEQTNDDPFTPGVGVQPNAGVPSFYLTPFPMPNMNAKNAAAYGIIQAGIAAVRLTLTAFATGNSVTAKFAPDFMRD